MGIGKLFGLSSSAGSSYSSQPQESYRPPLNNGSYHPTSSQSYRPPSSQSHRPPSSQSYHPPSNPSYHPPPSPGSSKLDFPNPSNPQSYHPPSSPGSSRLDFPSPSNPQSYHHGGDDAPPAYYPRYDHDDWAPDSKTLPAPEPYVGDFRFPIPAQINSPLDSSKEDPLLALKNFDIVIVLDDSRSMLQSDHIGGRTRWAQAWDALDTLVRVGSKYDTNGIDIYFLNNTDSAKTIKDARELQWLRDSIQIPAGGTYTPTGDALDTLLVQYRKHIENLPSRAVPKKRIFIVITDGAASDDPEPGIVNAARYFQKKGFPSDQVGIQFIQVGNDPGATEFLEALDRDLAKEMGEHARDIVDTTKSNGKDLEGDALVKALTGGFNRKQDKKGER